MNDKRWSRIEHLIDQALELPPADRAAFLRRECAATTRNFSRRLLPCLNYRGPRLHFRRKFHRTCRWSLDGESFAEEHAGRDRRLGYLMLITTISPKNWVAAAWG
ncbi:MAG: hypothetical protein U5K69_13765 [Balneolaceae bacterium]|nr:hypothetical protein [Balneolaceae bacterium]